VERLGVFSQVVGYDQSIVLLPVETLKRLAPGFVCPGPRSRLESRV
jgi:hypothetical protein